MIIWRQTTSEKTNYLGKDLANGAGSGPDNKIIDWGAIEKIGEYYVYKNNHNRYAEYSDTVLGTRPLPGASVRGPLATGAAAAAPYSNTEYPYGTGFYRTNPDGPTHGPYVFPAEDKNWVDWGDLLEQLPGYGFFTNVDNKNYTPCMVQPNGAITDGVELNEGFVKFLIQDVFAPLPKNRRCACRENHKPIKIRNPSNDFHQEERLNDVTYADLFGPLLDRSADDEPVTGELKPASFGNMDNFSIDYWLDSGSLLGAMRDGKMIKWDDDKGRWVDINNPIPKNDVEEDESGNLLG